MSQSSVLTKQRDIDIGGTCISIPRCNVNMASEGENVVMESPGKLMKNYKYVHSFDRT